MSIEGPAAVACVGGTVLALAVNAGVIQLWRALLLRRVRRQREPFHGDYATDTAKALDARLKQVESYATGLGFQVLMLLFSLVMTVLLYAGLWWELLRGEVPTVESGIFFFFALIDGSMMLGATISSVTERPATSS